jgi:hypothetical protein
MHVLVSSTLGSSKGFQNQIHKDQVMGQWQKLDDESQPHFVPTVIYRKIDAS